MQYQLSGKPSWYFRFRPNLFNSRTQINTAQWGDLLRLGAGDAA